MGAITDLCGGSVLSMLMSKYGDDIGKFIAIEKVKQFLDGKIGEVKTTINGQSDTMLNTTQSQIDTKKTQLNETVKKYRADIDKAVPGGVSSLERVKGQPLQDILGVNTFMQKFDDLKSTVNTKFSDEKTKAFKTLDQAGQEQKDKLDKQRPSVPLYDQLPPNQQQAVFAQGQKVFSQQISKNKDTLMKEMGNKLVPDTYLKNFSNVVPAGTLDGIMGNATSKFDSVSKLLTSGTTVGGVAGFVKTLF